MQQPTTPNDQRRDYDFIINPAKQSRTNLLQTGSNKSRALLVGVVLTVVLILFFVISSVFGGSDPAVPALIAVAQQQQELLHITDSTASQEGVGKHTAAFALSTNLVIQSEQTELLAYFKQNKIVVGKKVLLLRISKATDAQLAASGTASTYDKTFAEVMQVQISTYQKLLKQAYSSVKGERARALLNKDYDATVLLLKQLEYTDQTP